VFGSSTNAGLTTPTTSASVACGGTATVKGDRTRACLTSQDCEWVVVLILVPSPHANSYLTDARPIGKYLSTRSHAQAGSDGWLGGLANMAYERTLTRSGARTLVDLARTRQRVGRAVRRRDARLMAEMHAMVLREFGAPVFVGDDVVILSRHADVKAMLPDLERYSARTHVGGSRPEAMVARFSEERARMWREIAEYVPGAVERVVPVRLAGAVGGADCSSWTKCGQRRHSIKAQSQHKSSIQGGG
jgi:hypothetical protein